MAKLAYVYIFDVPYHADRQYTYYVPGDMENKIQRGDLVEVPFGKGNRRMTAVVFQLDEGEITESMKPVSAVTAEDVLSAEMLGLCLFVKEYTLCTYGDAVRAAVPSAALSAVVQYYKVKPEADMHTLPDSLSLRAREIFLFMRDKKKVSRQQLTAEFSFDFTAALQQLIKLELIEKCTESKTPSVGKTRTLVSLHPRIAERAGDDSGILALSHSLRSDNQRHMLQRLTESSWIEEKELYTLCGVSHQTGKSCLKVLLEREYAMTASEEVYRNPFAEEGEVSRPAAPSPLSDEQKQALETITDLYETGEPKAVLLHGVTGSGKTNVMLAAIDRVLADGRGVILLVPEIALTPQTVRIFSARFGDRIAVIHSSLSAGERFDAWRRIRDGLADVVIGTRSAVFAPLPNIGMILIDEEHEYTYKSETDPKYHAHDIARYRCRDHKAVMLLASATPSVASYYKAKKGQYTLVELKNRYGNARLPEVEICDMRGESSATPIGEVLAERLREDKKSGNQSVLFLNRRGYNKFVSCRSCGKSIQCPHCSVSLTYHTVRRGSLNSASEEDGYLHTRQQNGVLVCHMCGYRTAVPDTCPICGKPHFLFMGCGTQKAEDDIEAMFPELRVLRMDFDTTQAKFSHEALLKQFREGEADVLLGTQMVTKGHDFPKVATVGVLNADGSLYVDDYRANERTFAMLTQVIGRAGRGEIPGKAIIQTWNPDNEVLRQAAKQDYQTFYEGEIRLREALCYPPFCDMAVITLSAYDEGYLGQAVVRMQSQIRDYINVEFRDVQMVLYGPFEAPVYRVQNLCRMRFVMKCRLNKRTRSFIDQLMCVFGKGITHAPGTKMPVDGNPSDRRLYVTVDLNPSTI
ncbi:MAG: primosomal protein N' [Clostridia bacterium]|nr:primosomal protein N' [Clostridia bacterium]